MLEKMIIGTAQFGLDYGVNSSSAKKVSQHECNEILKIAQAHGINLLDTAEAYGDAIEKVANYSQESGDTFDIISKFLSSEHIISSLTDSLKKLEISSYHTILAHKSQDIFFNSYVQGELMKLKDNGLTRYIGVSIYSNSEFENAIDSPLVDVIQFPFNVLDNMTQRGKLMQKAKEKGKILHARSVYLQGMFLKEFPLPVRLRPMEAPLHQLKDLCRENGISITALALEYVFSNVLIDNVIIGHHKSSQLLANIDLIKGFKKGPYLKMVDGMRVDEPELLNPRNW